MRTPAPLTDTPDGQSQSQAPLCPAPWSPQRFTALLDHHGRTYRLTSDRIAQGRLIVVRVTWPTGDPGGLCSLLAAWSISDTGTQSLDRLHLRRRNPDTRRLDWQALTPAEAIEVITGEQSGDHCPGNDHNYDRGDDPTRTVNDLIEALRAAQEECLSSHAKVIVAASGAQHGLTVTGIEVLPYRLDPDTSEGVVGDWAAEGSGADPALVLFTEH